jgi:Co/Zn/Cd efflux system component
VNAVFLICIALAIVLEGVERLFAPPEINSDNLLLVGAGLVIPLIRSDEMVGC